MMGSTCIYRALMAFDHFIGWALTWALVWATSGPSVTSLATPPWVPEAVRLLQPDAPQPLTLLRPFILGGLLPMGIEPPT